MKKHLSLSIAVISSFGLFATLLSRALENPDAPFTAALLSFRYFTLQTNLFVAVYFWFLTLTNQKQSRWLETLLGGITIYISITFIVFALLLQGTWNPTGWGAVGNVFNHYLSPIAVILYVLYHRQHFAFSRNHMLLWLIYPITYLIFAMIHGITKEDYLYFFFDVKDVGWLFFSMTILGIFALYGLLALGMIRLTKKE